MWAEKAYAKFRDARAIALTGFLRGAFVCFGVRSRLSPPLRLNGARWIAIGSGVFVGEGCWLNCVRADDDARDATALVVGDDVVMSGFCTISAVRSVRIGRGVVLARGVYISDHGHARIAGVTSARMPDAGSPVVIDDNAWLGQNSCILPGVRIGRGAIVGANSVVTRNVPENAIAVGCPARVVKMLEDGPEY